METKPSFESQLKIGLKEEETFLKLLKHRYPHTIKIEGAFKEFDFYLPDIDSKVELKTDKKSNYTGNFVVETYHYGKPSGISTTTADFWVFNDGKDYCWITPDQIKNIILITGINQVRFVGNGDTVQKRAYLVPKELIQKEGKTWKVEEYV
tara:strand:- start:38 stop:490 length:453 start_codon:yes stop_codon:yes gene_type:complete